MAYAIALLLDVDVGDYGVFAMYNRKREFLRSLLRGGFIQKNQVHRFRTVFVHALGIGEMVH